MLPERLAIYTQGSESTGMGHVMRCLALAEQAELRGVDTCFVAHDGNTRLLLEKHIRGFAVHAEPPAARWVIHDIAGYNAPEPVRKEVDAGSRVLLMDDKGPARCYSSVVVDAMMTPDRAAGLPSGEFTEYCYGLCYTPLRQAIAGYAGNANPGQAGRVVVALGYGFPTGYLLDYCESMLANAFTGHLEILLPDNMGDMAGFETGSRAKNVTLHHNRQEIGSILCQADLLVTKLGMTQLEAFATGLGCLVVEPGEAHLEVQQSLSAHYRDWPAVECGLAEAVPPELLADRTRSQLDNAASLAMRGRHAAKLIDGKGCERILDVLFEETI